MSISIILAMAKNNVIGKGNELPWNLPTDLKRFKKLTTGKTIIMGRKCYESIGRPLPNRLNVVITRDKDFKAEGCEVRNNLHEAITEFNTDDELFIIGGAEIYKETFPIADKLYLTKILEDVEGDTIVSGLDENDWMLVGLEGHINEDDLNYRFMNYVSKDMFNREWLRDR